MAKEYEDIFVFAGSYADVDDARMDYDAIKALHQQDWIGKYQAAIFQKSADDKVEVLDTTSTTRSTGAKWGGAIGAVFGLIFPPGLLLGAAAGAGIGALVGNFTKGWDKSDVEDLGALLDAGQAGVILVAEATPDMGAEKLLKKAIKTEKKMVKDEDKSIQKELNEASKEVHA